MNELGESVYSDPELPAVSMLSDDEQQIKLITVTLDAPVEIPNGVCVTLTDNKSHTYRKLWNGEPLQFIIPNGIEFVASATNFITENGKEYILNESINVSENIITLSFSGKDGFELHNNVLCVYTEDCDWYINLNKQSGAWSKYNNSIPNVSVSEVLSSDADGFNNTNIIANVENDSIFANALKCNEFDNGVIGYIPSYIELELLSEYLPLINEYLVSKGKTKLSLDNIWVSESLNSNNAWNSDGESLPKNTTLDYYIFGKKIIL